MFKINPLMKVMSWFKPCQHEYVFSHNEMKEDVLVGVKYCIHCNKRLEGRPDNRGLKKIVGSGGLSEYDC